MTAVATVHLGEMVTQVRDELGTVESAVVAQAVYERMSDGERLAVLQQILPDAVRRCLNRPNELTEPGTSAGSMSNEETASGSVGTPKKLLGYYARRVYAPQFGERTLGEMTVEMIKQIAVYRGQQASELYDKAERWHQLALRMAEVGVERVEQLAVVEVHKILDGTS